MRDSLRLRSGRWRRRANAAGCAILLPAGMLATTVHAAPVDGAGAGGAGLRLQIGAGPAALGFRYREDGPGGSVLDREHGVLPGVCATALRDFGRRFVGVAGCYYAGTVSYDGQTQTGVPVNTDTDETLGDVRVEGGLRFGGRDSRRYSIYAMVGYRRWLRDIRSTASVTGPSEIYAWSYVGLGARVSLLQRGRWGWAADLRVREPLAPKVNIDFRGLYDPVTVRADALPGFAAALPLTYRVDPRLSVILTPYWDYWRLGRSDVATLYQARVPVGTVYEPASRSSSLGVSLQLSTRF